MDKFVEGQDLEVVKDRANLAEDDDKMKRRKEMRQRGEHFVEEEKKQSERPKNAPGSTMASRPKRDNKSGRYEADGGKEAAKERIKDK